MSGSTIGNHFKVTTWGESHGPALGCVVDGCPAGVPLKEEDIQYYLNLRKPGQSKFSTMRSESDQVEILSGVFEGKTTGTPISMIIRNQDQHSKDYTAIAHVYRPGHADYTYDSKYGFRDYRGGGRSSGRETIGRVCAGAIATRILDSLGICVDAYTKAIGPVSIDPEDYHFSDVMENPLYMPNLEKANEAQDYLNQLMSEKDSCGGVIECVITGMPAGIGEPVFDKLNARLMQSIGSIGAVKGIEFGDGFAAAANTGAGNNDPFMTEDGRIVKSSNHSGGILGGMSDGSPVIFRTAIKPTPSISQPQTTVTDQGEETTIEIHGRHDPVIVPRAVIVVQCMAAITVCDLLMDNMASRIDRIVEFYR